MSPLVTLVGLPAVCRRKPLQALKFTGVLLALVLGVSGFARLVSLEWVAGGALAGDGQFLALIGLPLVALGLVVIVAGETLVTLVRVGRAEAALTEPLRARPGYVLVRGLEAGVAVAGVALMATAVPVLFAADTPAPAGVGILLLLAGVGVAILAATLLRSGVELVGGAAGG